MTPLDLNAYLARIESDRPSSPMAEALERLHLAHATHVPFENLDIQLGRPILLDLDHLQVKLVRDRRGGYCFEQNTLFAAALEALGFQVTRLAARVRLGAATLLPRTHMLLKIDIDGGSWIADVGFGGDGLLKPVALSEGQVARQFAWSYRLMREGDSWVLQAQQGQTWQDQYAFNLEPHFHVDYEVANHYTSTHPSSSFVRTLTAQRPTPEARYILRNRQFSERRGDDMTIRTIADDDELLQLLAKTFGLKFPAGTRFRCLEGQKL